MFSKFSRSWLTPAPSCHFSHQPDEREGTEGTQDIDLDSDVGIDVSSEYSDGSLAVPTNWKVIMITSGVSGDTERLQWSIMTGVVSGSLS